MIAACSGLAAADPLPESILELPGSYPSDFFELADGRLGFVAYGADGNSSTVHALNGAEHSVLAVWGTNRRPVALTERYTLANANSYFEVYDAGTGQRLKRKKFEQFFPPARGANAWVDGDVLTLISSRWEVRSTMRRIRLPELEVIERAEALVMGTYVRWQDKFVAIGYMRENENSLPRPAITVLDSQFHVVAQSDIAPNAIRDNSHCPWTDFAKPYVMGDLLVYSSDCGGVRVHNLKTMQQVAARGPIDRGDAVAELPPSGCSAG